tara:strand:- start:1090 stop:1281 length:192 start_codon:yes stop_codon:yes gene_type:complete
VRIIKTLNAHTAPATTHATAMQRLQQLLDDWFLSVKGENQPLQAIHQHQSRYSQLDFNVPPSR